MPKTLLDEAILDRFEGMSHGTFSSTDGGHGRIETRRTWVSDEVHLLGKASGRSAFFKEVF